MSIIMKDQSDKSWLKSANITIENYETHWNRPYPNSKPRRFLFAALIILCVFLLIFGNQLAKSNEVEKIQSYDISHYATPIKNDNEFWWPGNICIAPSYSYQSYQKHYFVPISKNKTGTVPEPGTTLLIGLGLIAMAIKFKPRVKGMSLANCSRNYKIAAGDIEHRKTSIK